jgi:hypothetical protein
MRGCAHYRLAGMLVLALLGAATGVSHARADNGLFVGASGNALKFEPAEAIAVARDLGIAHFRISILWNPGQASLSAAEQAHLDRAVELASDLRIIVSVYSEYGKDAPVSVQARDEYCGYVRGVLERYPQINDVLIWIEPNKEQFWRDQFNADGSSAAPKNYVMLLARCWDVLHAFRPGVNVIAPGTSPRGNDRPHARSNISHSPGRFIREMGKAYRALGRTRPLFDTVGHNAYGEHSAERPWRRHRFSTTISEGDWNKLMQALWDAFHGTAQRIPAKCTDARCVSIWYLEIGYQTAPDAEKNALYEGTETDPHPIPDFIGEPETSTPDERSFAPDQATQILDGIRLAYCQPYVGAYFIFNLQLWDDPNLGWWQSAPLWADRTRKDSYPAFAEAMRQVRERSIDCRTLKGGRPPTRFTPRLGVDVFSLDWSERELDAADRRLGFRIRTAEDAVYRAAFYRIRHGVVTQTIADVRGTLRRGFSRFVAIPVARLGNGEYEIQIWLTSKESRGRRTKVRSPRYRIADTAGRSLHPEEDAGGPRQPLVRERWPRG